MLQIGLVLWDIWSHTDTAGTAGSVLPTGQRAHCSLHETKELVDHFPSADAELDNCSGYCG